MLAKLWERMEGYDRWIPVEATIESSELAEVEVGPGAGKGNKQPLKEWRSFCTISWVDSNGGEHKARFEVSEGSPLFQLYEGQTVAIRYDPGTPNEFYLPGVLKSKVVSTLTRWTLIVVLALIALFILFIH